MKSELTSVKHEHEQWDYLFKLENKKNHNKLYSSYWWQEYYGQIARTVSQYISPSSKILEAGCGSGKASIVLGEALDITLLDISAEALKFADLIARRFGSSKVKFQEGDIFNLPFKDMEFDFVWNVGVIEHYETQQAIQIVANMINATKKGGHIAVGVPNFKSPQIIKAKLINRKYLSWVPGYKLDTEISYTEKDLHSLVRMASIHAKRGVTNATIYRVGSPLPVESPKFVVKSFGKPLSKLMPERKFLYLIIASIE